MLGLAARPIINQATVYESVSHKTLSKLLSHLQPLMPATPHKHFCDITCCRQESPAGAGSALNLGRAHARPSCSDPQGH